MSDMRDFTPVRDDGDRFAEPVIINQPIRDDVVIVDDGGLGNFHVNSELEESGARRSRLYAGIAVALVFGLAGAWGVSQFIKDQPVVADEDLPSPSAPARTAAMPPPAAATEAEATTQGAPVPAPVPAPAMTPTAPDPVRSAPVTGQAARHSAPRMMAAPGSSTAMTMPAPGVAPAEPALTPAPGQAASTPEPVSPAVPASSLAGNPAQNEQSVSPDQTVTPQAVPATPEAMPAPAQPVPDQGQTQQ